MATAQKTKYHYIAAYYNALKDGQVATFHTSYFCTADDEFPSGIPTMGLMVKKAREFARSKGFEFADGTFSILSIIQLTKEQYDQLRNNEEPQD